MTVHADAVDTWKIDEIDLTAGDIGLTTEPNSMIRIVESDVADEYELITGSHTRWDGNPPPATISLTKLDPNVEVDDAFFETEVFDIDLEAGGTVSAQARIMIRRQGGNDAFGKFKRIEIAVVTELVRGQPGGSARGGRN